MQSQRSFPQQQTDDTDDDDMGQSADASSKNQTRSVVNRATASRMDPISGDVGMQSDEATVGIRSRAKHGEPRPDLRTGIIQGDLRDAISSSRNQATINLRQKLRPQLGNVSREDNNDDDLDDVDMETPIAEPSGKSSVLNRKASETRDAQMSKGGSTKPIFSKPSPKAVGVNSVVQVAPASALVAEVGNMPPPKPKNLFVPSSKAANSRAAELMPPPSSPSSTKPNLFVKQPSVTGVPTSDRSLNRDGSLTPIHPSSPNLRAQKNTSGAVFPGVRVLTTLTVSKSIPGFMFGEQFLKHRSQILNSPQFKQRFCNEANGRLAELHDDMCHRNEWEDRQQSGKRSFFQPTFETAYSDHELRRDTKLTTLCRSIKGITKTLDHIQKNFKGDANAAREQYSGSFYPTLRAAENDLKNAGNKPYSKEWIIAVERMIKFCIYMYYLDTEQNNSDIQDMHSKSLELAHKFILLLMDAYKEMWAQHVMPPNCEEFCALSLATSALARIANNGNKFGGVAALCGVYFELPFHIRQKPQVKQTFDVLLSYFSDNVTRFFEFLESRCPYLVVLMCSSESYQIRCRFLKNFFPAKLEKFPFETLAR